MTARIVNKPNTRPDIVNARASQRLWGSALIPNGARQIVAVGVTIRKHRIENN